VDSELQPSLATASLLSLRGVLRNEIFESEDGSESRLQKMVLSEVNRRRLKFGPVKFGGQPSDCFVQVARCTRNQAGC